MSSRTSSSARSALLSKFMSTDMLSFMGEVLLSSGFCYKCSYMSRVRHDLSSSREKLLLLSEPVRARSTAYDTSNGITLRLLTCK